MTHDTSRWAERLKAQEERETLKQYEWNGRGKFAVLKKYAEEDSILLEVGAGSGRNTQVIKKYILACAVSDVDVNVVRFLEKKGLLTYKINVLDLNKEDNIVTKSFRVTKWDIVFSDGLMEHFTPAETVKAISNLRRIASMQIHFVPTDQDTHRENIYGDERFYSIKKIKKIYGKGIILRPVHHANLFYHILRLFIPYDWVECLPYELENASFVAVIVS